MSKNIFITATGTDIGKTYVSALIVKKMRESGFDCGYFKPVLSGVEEKNVIIFQHPDLLRLLLTKTNSLKRSNPIKMR